MPRKPQSPIQRREAQQATAGRAALEKDERTAKDASLDTKDASHDTSLTNVSATNAAQNDSLLGHGTRLNNIETLNANQTTLLQTHTSDIAALGTRITNQEAVNTAQQTNIVSLLDFRNRAAGFAVADHFHDERYYGKGTTDIWFLRHNLHPDGIQLHGSAYHAIAYAPAVHSHA